MLKLDIGSGKRSRGDIGIDVEFNDSSPMYNPSALDCYPCGQPHPSPRLIKADANYPLPFGDGIFDKVTIVHTLEHLFKPYECLCEIKRVLKNDGELTIIVPDSSANRADWNDASHCFSFTPPSLTTLVSMVFTNRKVENIMNGQDILAVCKK